MGPARAGGSGPGPPERRRAGPQSGDGRRAGGIQVVAGQQLLEILPPVAISAGVAVGGVPQQTQEQLRVSQPHRPGRLNDSR